MNTPDASAKRRQGECEAAYRDGWEHRKSGGARTANPWAETLANPRALADHRADASHRVDPWFAGWDGASALASRVGEEEMQAFRLTVVPERCRAVRFEDQPAFFAAEEVPEMPRSLRRLSESARLHRLQGTREAPTLADEQ